MIKKPLDSLNREELKSYIFEIQDSIDSHLKNGGDVDSFIDETDLFDDFEDVLPDEEYGIFVITLLNGIRSETVLNTLLDSLIKGIQSRAAISSI
jgi:hypothetical protein|tara:strand:+ start:423 stop:707 length:285 start_codon:yes stop_codon:yes gene_type:complete